MNISFFSGNIKNTKQTREITITDFLNYVKYGEFKKLQESIQAINDPVKRKEAKSSLLPYVTISGVFLNRANDNLISHSGFMAMDFDDLNGSFDEVRKLLNADPYSYSVFKSVSGNGLCALVKINPNKHNESFRWLEKYYYETYGFVIDQHCKDVSRPRFISYDVDEFRNEKSLKAKFVAEKKTQPKKINFVATETQIDRIVTEICSRGINIAESYEEYYHCAMAFASEFGEGGRQYFHAVASMSSKYSEREANRKYDHCLKSTKRVKIGTFLYYAKHAGVQLFSPDEKRAQDIAISAKRSKTTVQGAVDTAVTICNLPEKVAREAAEAVFAHNESDLYQDDDDTPVIEQIANFVDVNHKFRRNEVTLLIEDRGREFNKQFLNTIYCRAKAVIGNKVVKNDIEALVNSDRTENFNPFIEFFNLNRNLPNRPEIIDKFISGIESDTPGYDRWVRKWLIGIPAACKGEIVRTVIVFCGGQYSGKTSWFRELLPEPLSKYYAESRLDRGKDDEIGMTQKLIIMDDEFGGKSRKDAEKFKELVSKKVFFLREPYGTCNVDLRRLAILCGTSNDTAIINDPTGNTRILPINILSLDHDIYNSVDKVQLFVELWRAYESGETHKLDVDDLKDLAEISSDHEEITIERELLQKFFAQGNLPMTATDIKNYIETHSVQKIQNLRKLGIEMKKFFGKSKAIKENGIVKYCYYVDKLKEDNNPSTSQSIDNVPF
jgi:hypothetical protein